jgi:hypothetical protein
MDTGWTQAVSRRVVKHKLDTIDAERIFSGYRLLIYLVQAEHRLDRVPDGCKLDITG